MDINKKILDDSELNNVVGAGIDIGQDVNGRYVCPNCHASSATSMVHQSWGKKFTCHNCNKVYVQNLLGKWTEEA